MSVDNMRWMEHSICIASEVASASLKVGAVVISEENQLLSSAYTGENCSISWASTLIDKLQKLKISRAHSVYVTINTMLYPDFFDLLNLLRKIHIDNVYVGLPDPALSHYVKHDPIIELEHVYRYPDELQNKILKQNYRFFADSSQNIKYSPYYFENRISSLVQKHLESKGFPVSRDELSANKNRVALATLLSSKYKIEYGSAFIIVNNAISEAFNGKYSTYNYSKDTRSLDLDWEKRFLAFYQHSSSKSLPACNILNIGVGGGHEAISLFSSCPHITFADIAPDGLKKIKEKIPWSKTILVGADNLSSIPDGIYDLYVSLRTFNSSFFNIKGAISEAKRVLKSNALIILSVANGFLCQDRNCIIPGLIIPGTEFVDIYRGMDTIKQIRTELLQLNFREIEVLPTATEIYISAIAN